ncbi:hypothetical protein [Lentibacillus jeotgali]|uniref:hypothetical protein n=1 Tax=Lentibacillus jeotgali TaxID=558169 RepID=UPI0002625C6D|nr:hypothetical protein [Lentibacillus jeotgali]
MKNNHKFLMVMLIGVSLILAACGNSSEQEGTQDSPNINQETETDSSEDAYSGQEAKTHDNQAEEQSQEELLEEYVPNEDDVVLKHNNLKNKGILEAFMKVAGENGENNESEIRVVKDEGANGVLIYDLKSRYDKNADQAWIGVIPDLSHYSASENDVQDVFNNARQQCSYMSKDKQEGYYKLNECRTHWEYRFLPIVN